MQAVIECGANNGTSTEKLLSEFNDCSIIAIEPTRELLYNNLYPKFDSNERVKILPFAVDVCNGFKKFNVAGQADWGCSSLHSFTDNIHEKWPGRPDFNVTHTYTVPTIRLEDICRMYDIKKIKYLWIDTQGNDFNCLLSLGNYIEIVDAGRVEVADSLELYKDTNNTLNNVKEWLEMRGFSVTVGGKGYEVDLYFNK